jgi:hypothetical protein
MELRVAETLPHTFWKYSSARRMHYSMLQYVIFYVVFDPNWLFTIAKFLVPDGGWI